MTDEPVVEKGGRSVVRLFLLSGFLLFPSLGTVQRYLGLTGVVLYILLGIGAIWLTTRFYSSLTGRLRLRSGWWLLLTVLGTALLVALIYPYANSGVVGGGSDRDDALLVAGRALLSGDYPYDVRTYLDNPITPLPGALLLALPFVLLQLSLPSTVGMLGVAMQNVVWLALLGFFLRRWWGNATALLALWLPLAFSPALLRELATGSDLWANSVYVLLAVFWWRQAREAPRRILAALFLGLTLSSRFNFLLLMPLIAALMVRRRGVKGGLEHLLLVSGSWLAVTLPFWIYAPDRFSPLHTYGELGRFEAVLPGAGWLIPLLSGILALVLALRLWRAPGEETGTSHTTGSTRMLLRSGAWVLAAPVLAGTVLNMLDTGRLTFGFAGFGVAFLAWGILGYLGSDLM